MGGGGGGKLSFWISLVVSSIVFVYFATMFGFIERCFGLWSSLVMLNAISFTTVIVLGISSYVVAMFTDSGRVPASYMLPTLNIMMMLIIPFRRSSHHHDVQCGGHVRGEDLTRFREHGDDIAGNTQNINDGEADAVEHSK
nr:probable protein S-acyltransferase 16 [Ipomoea batatas]GME16961.1 probable protein S-acyltransferase 16 [Ipomoea batatas]